MVTLFLGFAVEGDGVVSDLELVAQFLFQRRDGFENSHYNENHRETNGRTRLSP